MPLLYVVCDNTARAGRRSQPTRTPTVTNDNERREGETEEVMIDEIRQYQDFRRLENRSKLEAFFKLNREDQEARRYLYAEIPEHYTWDNKNSNGRDEGKLVNN
ncbi:unnamed protein product [Psylliodes chrysocephalus]|uniref:Uncharacterized protein n=1 Tax=Psylliodes chrysocephalus TaxID=3402493 RepID=A0A9P0DC78_9CUCU|nr:unnamed protein product [Psylliodes chrysocephala]